MKTFFVTFLSLGLWLGMHAQATDTIYSYVDTMPEYPGGETVLLKHLRDSLQYPLTKWDDEYVTGRIIIRFVVNEDGTTSEFHLLRTPHNGLAKEAIRILKTMKPFKPAIKDGKPVKVYYTLPIYILLK